MVLSENGAEGLVRTRYRGAAAAIRETHPWSNAAPLGYFPAEDGPSGPVSRRRVDDLPVQGTRRNIKHILENRNPAGLRIPAPINDQRQRGYGFQRFFKRASERLAPDRHESQTHANKGNPHRAL